MEPPKRTSPAERNADHRPDVITSLLGWAGAVAMVLAAGYLIRLAYDNGYLTPARQVAIAVVIGLGLVGVGFALREKQRHYASLLPAAGTVILFLSVYGGHLYYNLIGQAAAATSVLVLCGGCVFLARAFESDLYVLFALVGTYSAPFLLPNLRGTVTDLAIYFSAIGVVFSALAIWQGRRLIYLLALYMALIGFDPLWLTHVSNGWVGAVWLQTSQLLIFGAATVVFSVRRNSPLDLGTAVAHMPPLVLFYFLQFAILDQHVPELALWIALASLAFVVLIYMMARRLIARPLPGGELLLWNYAALVMVHAGYIESVSARWAPWVGVALVPVVGVLALRRAESPGPRWPMILATGIIFLLNYMRVIFNEGLAEVPGHRFLPAAYAIVMYVGYAISRRTPAGKELALPLLCVGHITAMVASIHLLDEGIVQSAIWAVLAVGSLIVSKWTQDRLLGQSSLMIFALAAGKALLFDLSGATPLPRIIALVVLGAAFYAGGLLYQRMFGSTAEKPPTGS